MRLSTASSFAPVMMIRTACLLLLLPLVPADALAQDEFGDEFGDDGFEDAAPSATPPAEESPGPVASDDEFGDPTTAAPTPRAASVESSDDDGAVEASGGRGRGGDLISDPAPAAWRNRRLLLHNSWHGSVGGIHVVDAGSGPSESFRVQLLTDFFIANGFLFPDDQHQHIGGSLSLSWAFFDFIELYGSIKSYANSNPTEDPSLFQVLGDTTLGIKGYYEVLPFLILGGDIHIDLLNTVGDIGLVGDSTSVGIRANATLDFRGLEEAIPLIARLNLEYYFDNSQALIEDVEQRRYEALPTTGVLARAATYRDESRNLLSRVERFALNINRTDFFNIAIGVEAPFTVMEDFHISPVAEWRLGIPVNRNGFSCLYIPDPFTGGPLEGDDGCLEKQGFDAFPSTLTLGVRVLPPFRGLALTAAIDIGTSGMSSFVRELAGNAPYDVILGASYAFDTVPQTVEVVREVERRVEVPAQGPLVGRVLGTVVEQGTSVPVAGAIIRYAQEGRTAQVTAHDGTFSSYEFPPGEVRVEISHDEYETGTCSATIGEHGEDVQTRCELVALPRVGELQGTLVSDTGSPVAGASVQISGPQTFSVTTDVSGRFVRNDLPPGNYVARIEADGYLITQDSFVIEPRGTATPNFTVVARPARSLVTLRDREIVIRRQVNFATDSADILPDSTALLTEVADALLRHPEVRRVEIQGHTDSNGDDDANMALSQRRAEAVRDWLIRAGVDRARLRGQGYGETRPLVPNITASNRARNRRVQFIIEERLD